MLIHTQALIGKRLDALDGEIGSLQDIYFDDEGWAVRYLVADTGSWMHGRLVLLAPNAIGHVSPSSGSLTINLTTSQIEASPPIESHKPVSRQYEIDYYRHYGWPAYWDEGASWSAGGLPELLSPLQAEVVDLFAPRRREDPHLRSVLGVLGYEVQSKERPIGTLAGLRLDEKAWRVRQIVVGAGLWPRKSEIRIPVNQVEDISYEESKIFLSSDKEAPPSDEVPAVHDSNGESGLWD